MRDRNRTLLWGSGLALLLSAAPRISHAQEAQAAEPAPVHETGASGEHAAEHGPEHAAEAGAEHGAEHEHGEENEPHHHVHIGLVGTMLAGMSEGRTELLRGGGLLFTWLAVPEHFEIELVPHLLMVEDGFEAPIDLLAVVPIPISHVVEPFVAAGGLLVPYAIGQQTGFFYGFATAAGAHFRLTRSASLLVEFNYNGVWHSPTEFVNELGGSIGPVIAF